MNLKDKKLVNNRVAVWSKYVKDKKQESKKLESKINFYAVKIEKLQKEIKGLQINVYEIDKKLQVLNDDE